VSKHSKLVQGIGTNSGKYPATSNNKALKEYEVWNSMLKRCANYYWVKFPTYEGTTCSENFKNYTFFYEWCQEQVGFKYTDENGKSWHLDKDLLVKGNKVYSEGSCCFLPLQINITLTKSNSIRGNHSIGVHWRERSLKFVAQCNQGSGVQKHLGYFTTAREAFKTYKCFKEGYIKSLAEKYKHQLDPRAYEALINYQVQETD